MKYNQLGNSDLVISEVSFGCMSLGDNDKENGVLLHQALDNGINFFDTADLYQKGNNEITLGRAFKGIRYQIIISTKVGNQWKPDGSGWDWNPSKEYILESVDKSLERLQTDYIDFYQLHGGTINDLMEETIEAFEILKKQGKIRYYGISSIRPNVIREYVKRSKISGVMMQYSLLDRRPEEECLDLLRDNSIGVLARGTLAKGLLINKPAASFLNHSENDVKRAADAVQTVAANKRGLAETAVRYALHHPAITSAVIGIRTQEQLKECLKIGETMALNSEEYTMLANAISPNKYEDHR